MKSTCSNYTTTLAHVSDFEARDFLDAALAMLDQASVRSAAANRAYKAVEVVIAEETPEEAAPTCDNCHDSGWRVAGGGDPDNPRRVPCVYCALGREIQAKESGAGPASVAT